MAMAGFLVGAAVITDNSLLTHVATGELILEGRSVPTVDPYSATAAGQGWTVQSWLASVLYAALDAGLGPPALRVLHGMLAGAVAVGVWKLTAPARQLVPRVGLTLLPVALGVAFWSPRPFMFGLLGMVALLHVLQGNAPPWVMAPVMWLWVNTHGSFPLAVVLGGAVLAGAWLDHRRWPADEGRALGWTLGGLALGGVNPVGPALLWFPVELLGRREALEGVVEWTAPRFESPGEWLYLVLLPVMVAAAGRGAGWRSLLPAVGFFAMGLVALRNINVAAVVIVALLAPALRDLVGSADGDRTGLAARAAAVCGVAGLLVGAVAASAGPGLDLTAYPADEIDALEEQGLVATDGVVLVHREGVGNYLTWRYGRSASVFIDDRFDFYPLDLTTDHLHLLEGGDHGEILDRRRADVVLWESDSSLAYWLRDSERWQVVIDGDAWLVACRRASPAFDRCARIAPTST